MLSAAPGTRSHHQIFLPCTVASKPTSPDSGDRQARRRRRFWPPRAQLPLPNAAAHSQLPVDSLRRRFGRLRAFSEALRHLGLAGDSTPAGLALLTGGLTTDVDWVGPVDFPKSMTSGPPLLTKSD